jgi:hypothetical protein
MQRGDPECKPTIERKYYSNLYNRHTQQKALHVAEIVIIIISLTYSWPPVDPFRSGTSRSPFNGLTWFLLPVCQ